MNNVVRKAIRVIVDQLDQLKDASQYNIERRFIEDARILLVRADQYDFHLNPKKKFVVPKSDFKFIER